MSDFSGSIEASLDNLANPNDFLSAGRPPEGWNYEATVRQIEAIVAQIEAGDLELAEVFEQFATAVAYLQQCETFLTQRQKQVDLLIETLTDEPDF